LLLNLIPIKSAIEADVVLKLRW